MFSRFTKWNGTEKETNPDLQLCTDRSPSAQNMAIPAHLCPKDFSCGIMKGGSTQSHPITGEEGEISFLARATSVYLLLLFQLFLFLQDFLLSLFQGFFLHMKGERKGEGGRQPIDPRGVQICGCGLQPPRFPGILGVIVQKY